MDTEGTLLSAEMAQARQNAKGQDRTADELQDVRPSELGPLGAEDVDAQKGDDAAAAWSYSAILWGFGVSKVPCDEWKSDGAASCIRVAAGFDRPDASPVTSSRHCSLLLFGSCPPACLRHMRSARASRPGRESESEWKELGLNGAP